MAGRLLTALLFTNSAGDENSIDEVAQLFIILHLAAEEETCFAAGTKNCIQLNVFARNQGPSDEGACHDQQRKSVMKHVPQEGTKR